MKKLIVITIAIGATLSPAFAAKQYSYFRVGNANDVTASTTPGTVLMGGGTDVDAAFQDRNHQHQAEQNEQRPFDELHPCRAHHRTHMR